MKDGHVKDVAQGILGAAGGGREREGACLAYRYRPAAEPTPNARVSPPALALWCYVKDKQVKDATQDVAGNVPQDVAQDLAFGARAARALLATLPPAPPPPSLRSSQLSEMGAQLGSG